MLHIVNGDVVANKLKELKVQGDILVWRELLTDGPLSPRLLADDFLQMRARYMEEKLGIPAPLFIKGSLDQLRELQAFATHDHVLLWFEHDLFDQTMLSFLLDWFSRQELGSTRLELICIGDFPGIGDFRGLGQLTPAELSTLVGTEQVVTTEQLQLGSRAWQAYVSDDPTAVERLLAEDTSALPYLREAMLCHLRRFPTVNGVSHLERTVLGLLDQGIERLVPLFNAVSQAESVYGLGDLQFWSYLERMRAGDSPLLSIEGPSHLPRFDTPPVQFEQWRLGLTKTGREVLAGHSDWLVHSRTDRWIGGYHLTGDSPLWRWDAAKQRLFTT